MRRQLWGRTGALEQVKASKDRLPFQNFGDIRVQTIAESGDIIYLGLRETGEDAGRGFSLRGLYCTKV